MRRGRVIFGELKHRILELPEVSTTRPTSDALKEAIFNCLIHRFGIDFTQWSVIDAFAGSGALGIETLSLGSPFALFFEQNPVACNTVRQNIARLRLEDRSVILRADVTKYKIEKFLPKIGQKVLAIFDPPYKNVEVLKSQIVRLTELFQNKELIIVAETDNTTLLKEMSPNHTLFASGDKKVFIFYKNCNQEL